MKHKQSNKKRHQEPQPEVEVQQEEEGHEEITWKDERQNVNGQEEEADGQQQLDLEIENEDEMQQRDVEDLVAQNERNLEQYQQEIGNRGVVYMSRIPPYMTPSYIRKLLEGYDVERIYLLPESEWARKNRIKHGGSKRICFREGWIEFEDKRVAKNAALTLNGQKMLQKKGSFYSEDLWNLKYLPKFKWHHLTEKLAHEQRLKKQRLRLEMDQERRLQEHYTTQIHKSKIISGIIKSKTSKGKQLENKNSRSFGQKSALKEEQN